MSAWTFVANNAFLSFYTFLHAWVAKAFFSEAVTAPYMDEVFHVTQTQAFCKIFQEKEWTYEDLVQSYHPKITTPPGPYLMAAPYSMFVLGDKACSLASVRSINVAFNVGTAVVVYLTTMRLYGSASYINNLTRVAVVILSPVHFFFAFLFYTDAGSTFFVLLSYYFSLGVGPRLSPKQVENWMFRSFPSMLCSAIAGFLSLWFRQTNVVWYGFILGTIFIRVFDPTENQLPFTKYGKAFCMSIVDSYKKRRHDYVAAISTMFCIVIPALSVIASFFWYLKWNQYSIVLGDKSNHVPVFHVTQILYFLLFAMAPFHLSMLSERGIDMTVDMMLWSWKTVVGAVVVIILVVAFCTKVHPFILADNRHFTFYLWSKYLRHKIVRYALVVPYLYCGIQFVQRLLHSKGSLWTTGYFICVCTVLIPAHLVEFRYWVIPAIIGQMHIFEKDDVYPYLTITVLGYVVCNALLIHLFIFGPFPKDGEIIGRFMFWWGRREKVYF